MDEHERALHAESVIPIGSATIRNAPCCESVVVRTGDGRVFDLGSPESWLFRERVLVYRIKRKLYG